MRGRGIGTARGRATIMRGVFVFSPLGIEIDIISISKRFVVGGYHFYLTSCPLTLSSARRGRGVAPQPRGIRR